MSEPTPANVTSEHRAAAAKLFKVAVQPRCVEQWIDGMALPAWAEKPFAEVVATAQLFAEAEARGRAAERADILAHARGPAANHRRHALLIEIERGEHLQDGCPHLLWEQIPANLTGGPMEQCTRCSKRRVA